MGRDLTKELKDIKISEIACSIEKELVHLIKTKPFYAHFIQTMDRIITESVETMGVNITDGINLFINPRFFNALKPKERVACLEHEVLHILNKHILRSRNKNPLIFNIAGDCAINQYIQELPKGALLPKHFKLEENKETEYYYKKLMKNVKQYTVDKDGNVKDEKGNTVGKVIDDHSLWDKGNKDKDYQHQIVKNVIKKTLEHTKDYGHLPQSIQQEIRKALLHEVANWRSILQRFINRATLVFSVPTRKKLNRRFGFYYDGTRVECKLDLLVAIDTSGSISDGDLSLFFSEIDKIKALGMRVTIAEIDADVHRVYRYNQMPKSKGMRVYGRGGTDFKPLFHYVKNKMKQKPDCIIYLTDLYADLKFKNPTNIPCLWAITQNGGNIKDIPFGTGIKLKDDIGSV